MEQVEQNNPAGRLHTIVARLIEENKKKVDVASSQLWAAVFEIPAPSKGGEWLYEIASRLLQLRKLIDETENSLKQIEGLPERYFRPFFRLRALPANSLGSLASGISGTINLISEGDMTVLEFCSERLAAQHAEPIIDEGELRAILEDVSGLFDAVQESGLDPELKTFILDALESIRRGIFEFRIRGPQRLKETLAEIIGSMVVNHDVIQAVRDQDEGVVKRFETAFYRLAAAVSFAVDGPALISAFKTALLPSGG
jgi:hypothetical protein